MPRFLALDWDAQHLHLVSGDTGRKGVRVDKAVTWTLPEELKPANAEALGRSLRDFLRTQGMAPAPVLACVGRERVILKDLRFPPVSAAEEPGLVRFQATKDLSDAPDEVIIDYTYLKHPEVGGERQVMAVIARRGIAASLQGLCRGLGTKLLAMTPRAYGLAGALERGRRSGAIPEAAQQEQVAALAIGERWAELIVARGRQVLYARSPALGPTLAGEVKRSLALFAAHNPGLGDGPQALLVAGGSEHEPFRARLQEVLSLPVLALEPWTPQEAGIGGEARGVYAAGVGLLHLWGVTGAVPINFLAPKQAKPVSDFQKRRGILFGAGAGALVIGLILFAVFQLADKRKTIAQLNQERAFLEDKVKKQAQDRLDIDYLADWDLGTISWIDELHDLTAHFPREEGFRLNQLNAAVITRKAALGKDKDKFVAHISLLGVAAQHHDKLLGQLVDSLNQDGHLRATVESSKGAGPNSQVFLLKVDLAKHNAKSSARPAALKAPAVQADTNGEGGQQ